MTLLATQNYVFQILLPKLSPMGAFGHSSTKPTKIWGTLPKPQHASTS